MKEKGVFLLYRHWRPQNGNNKLLWDSLNVEKATGILMLLIRQAYLFFDALYIKQEEFNAALQC